MSAASPLLELQGLEVRFPLGAGQAAAVTGLDLHVEAGEVVALVGESGCGKSATALAIMGLLPPGATIAGRILWRGEPLVPEARRGRELAMVFQEPATALNPVARVRTQIAEPLRAHRRLRGAALREELRRCLVLAGLEPGDGMLEAYPHQLSGGQRQRVMLAMALACRPRLLLADEPTTALDASLKGGLLQTLDRLRRELGLAILLVSHDFGVVERIAQRIAVIYAGRIVEQAPGEAILSSARHPYTQSLLACRLDPFEPGPPRAPIQGQPPSLGQRPPGCAFHPRCPLAQPRCAREVPAPTPLAPGAQHRVACPVVLEAPHG